MKVDELYADMQTTMGAMHTRQLEQSFLFDLSAVVIDLNRVINDTVDAPTEISSAEIGFAGYCDNVFHPGVKFYMQRSGQWAQEPDPQSYQFYQQQLKATIGPAILEIDDFPTR